MTNIELLEYSRKNPIPLIDPYYNKGELVIPSSVTENNSLTIANSKLLELITVFNFLDTQGYSASSIDINKVVNNIIKILDTVKGINYSPFSQFFMVYNSTYSTYLSFSIEKKRHFIYEMLKLYCRERHSIYQSHGYSNSILQVISDNYSHKRNSKSTIDKITDVLESLQIKHNADTTKFITLDSFYMLPDKGNSQQFTTFKSYFTLQMKSADIEHGKLPDIVFKLNDHYFILEAKMMKGAGGGQDKQIVEIINFIRYSESRPNFHYVTYLDGEYSDLLFAENRSPKIQRQYDDLILCLTNCPNNYFVNPAGFNQLITIFTSASKGIEIAAED